MERTDAFTWGELLSWVEAMQEGHRQRRQEESVLAYRQAWLTGLCVSGGTMPEVYEVFPFWTQEEQNALRLSRYRHRMERWAAGKQRKEETRWKSEKSFG